MANKIKQPKNVKIKAMNAEMTIEWNKTFGKENTERFHNVQKFVDSECIRYMAKYTPKLNGIMFKSAVLGTKIGSGKIEYTVPYARYQYYGKLMVSSTTGSSYASKGESKVLTDKSLVQNESKNPLGQPFWFKVMKQNHKEAIIRGANNIARRQ